MRTVWQIASRITNEILGVKGLKVMNSKLFLGISADDYYHYNDYYQLRPFS